MNPSLSKNLRYRCNVKQSSEIEPDRPEPLRALVVVGAVGDTPVLGLVAVVVVASVGPVPGVEGGEAEGSEEEVGDGGEGGESVLRDVGTDGERNDVVAP